MNVYLAARFGRRSEMKRVAERLARHGHRVVSRWVFNPHDMTDKEADERGELDMYARRDVADVLAADALALFAEPGEYSTGGRHVEFGVALATGKRLVVVGPSENIFHRMNGVWHTPNADTLVTALEAIEAAGDRVEVVT